VFLWVFISGCSLLGTNSKQSAEKVSSCFADDDDQTTYCKSKRMDHEGKLATTRCIGAKNEMADPKLRGKCVEKICTPGSNTDCYVIGVIAVLDQYTELTNAHLFTPDDASQKEAKESTEKSNPDEPTIKVGTRLKTSEKVAKEKAPKDKKEKSAKDKEKLAKLQAKEEADDEESSMQLVLRPARKSSRAPASVIEPDTGYKKFCVAKTEKSAPKHLRGKCAVRSCSHGKCSYKGRKEIVDWASSQSVTSNNTTN
jgi:hypothetical protein